MIYKRPVWKHVWLVAAVDPSVFVKAFKHADDAVLTQPAKVLLRLAGRAYLLQAVFAFATALYVLYRIVVYGAPKQDNHPAVKIPALLVRDYLQYRGNILTEADIPLVDKELAIQYIASDWSHSFTSRTISIDYDIDRGIWDGISSTEPAVLSNQWYPASMTEGQGFDYEILRRYDLKNEQEGIQLRTFGNGRYLVTYAFEDPPQVPTGQITHHIFGRLRVTTVEK